MASSQTSRNQTLVRVQEPMYIYQYHSCSVTKMNVEHTQAVHALERIRANDDVGDGRAVLEDEDRAVATSVFV